MNDQKGTLCDFSCYIYIVNLIDDVPLMPMSRKELQSAIMALENVDKFRFDEEDDEVWLTAFVKFKGKKSASDSLETLNAMERIGAAPVTSVLSRYGELEIALRADTSNCCTFSLVMVEPKQMCLTQKELFAIFSNYGVVKLINIASAAFIGYEHFSEALAAKIAQNNWNDGKAYISVKLYPRLKEHVLGFLKVRENYLAPEQSFTSELEEIQEVLYPYMTVQSNYKPLIPTGNEMTTSQNYDTALPDDSSSSPQRTDSGLSTELLSSCADDSFNATDDTSDEISEEKQTCKATTSGLNFDPNDFAFYLQIVSKKSSNSDKISGCVNQQDKDLEVAISKITCKPKDNVNDTENFSEDEQLNLEENPFMSNSSLASSPETCCGSPFHPVCNDLCSNYDQLYWPGTSYFSGDHKFVAEETAQLQNTDTTIEYSADSTGSNDQNDWVSDTCAFFPPFPINQHEKLPLFFQQCGCQGYSNAIYDHYNTPARYDVLDPINVVISESRNRSVSKSASQVTNPEISRNFDLYGMKSNIELPANQTAPKIFIVPYVVYEKCTDSTPCDQQIQSPKEGQKSEKRKHKFRSFRDIGLLCHPQEFKPASSPTLDYSNFPSLQDTQTPKNCSRPEKVRKSKNRVKKENFRNPQNGPHLCAKRNIPGLEQNAPITQFAKICGKLSPEDCSNDSNNLSGGDSDATLSQKFEFPNGNYYQHRDTAHRDGCRIFQNMPSSFKNKVSLINSSPGEVHTANNNDDGLCTVDSCGLKMVKSSHAGRKKQSKDRSRKHMENISHEAEKSNLLEKVTFSLQLNYSKSKTHKKVHDQKNS